MKQQLPYLLALLFSLSLWSQKEYNNWYFGEKAGVTFNTSIPTALTDNALPHISISCASMSDENGNLQFYTDGQTVMNKAHSVMTNGSGLLGEALDLQTVIIVPKPFTYKHYYIFTVNTFEAPGLYYSEVDMSAENGLGQVINKNIPVIEEGLRPNITARPKKDGTGTWLVCHSNVGNKFYVFSISEGGIDIVPIQSNAGPFLLDDLLVGDENVIKFSPTDDIIAMSLYWDGLTLVNFNENTGVITDKETFAVFNHAPFGIEFSNDGHFMYVSSDNGGQLLQFNMQAENIIASMKIVSNMGQWGRLEMGPDGKIYYARGYINALTVINKPELEGLACDVKEDNVSLNNKMPYYSLPNLMRLQKASPTIKATNVCLGEVTNFSLDSTIPVVVSWDFGDGSPAVTGITASHTYALPGTYTVSASVAGAAYFSVIQHQVVIAAPPVVNTPPDLLACYDASGQSFDLKSQDAAILGTLDPALYTVTYHTSKADAESGSAVLSSDYVNISNPETVYARVANAGGCYAVTQFMLRVLPEVEIDMDDKYSLCKDSFITVTAPDNFESYKWSTGDTTQAVQIIQPGTYVLEVTLLQEGNLCTGQTTISVNLSEPPVITKIEVNDWRGIDNSILVSVSGNGDYEYSLDGINYQDSPEFDGLEAGIYTVYARDRNGCGRDKEEVTVLTYPKFFTPNRDGKNDTWQVNFAYFEPGLQVHIFDRYGKLITSFQGTDWGWDGTLSGENLPASDYWFVAERKNGKVHKGHFSLLR